MAAGMAARTIPTVPETTLPVRMKSSTGLALHFMRKGLPRRSWACPAALRGVLKGEGASATTAPKCTKVQAPRKARCTPPRRVGEPTAHAQHPSLPHRTAPRADRRRTQSRTPHRHGRPHTNRQPRVHPPLLVPKPSLGPRRLTTLRPPSLAHRRWLGELG